MCAPGHAGSTEAGSCIMPVVERLEMNRRDRWMECITRVFFPLSGDAAI
jgi:hypothetical protein